MEVHITIFHIYTSIKMPHGRVVVTKMRFVGSNSQYIHVIYASADFPNRALPFNKALPWLNEINNYDFIYDSGISCEAINHTFNKTLLVFADFFTVNAHHTKKQTSVQSHTNCRFFKLVEAQPHFHSYFFSHYIKLRGFAAIISHCLAALPAKMSVLTTGL